MVLWARFVEAGIINTHSPFPGLLFSMNRIANLVRVVYLLNESSCQEFGDLLAYGPTPLIVKVTLALLGGL